MLEVASGAAALVVTASLARDLAGPNPVYTQDDRRQTIDTVLW